MMKKGIGYETQESKKLLHGVQAVARVALGKAEMQAVNQCVSVMARW